MLLKTSVLTILTFCRIKCFVDMFLFSICILILGQLDIVKKTKKKKKEDKA